MKRTQKKSINLQNRISEKKEMLYIIKYNIYIYIYI